MYKRQAANNYYNEKLDEEGRGRFPGQVKYDEAVGAPPTYSTDSTVAAMLELFVEQTLVSLDDFEDTGLSSFVYVFSTEANDPDAIQGGWQNTDTDVDYNVDGANDFKDLFGNNGMESPFQDGAYAYLVIPGYGSGTNSQAPALVVCDIENPTQLSKTLIP